MKSFVKSIGLAAALSTAALFSTAQAADEIKIGFVTTLTTGAGIIGKDMVKAVNLAMEHIGGKMAGKKVTVIIEDDGLKPPIGRQKTDKLVKQDNVDFVTGFIWSHVLLASRKSALDAGKFLISANAGPSPLAGKLCHKNFFNISWQNDQTPMALGEVLNQRGVKSVYLMSPNYAAGKNMVAGVERTFKGKIAGKDMTKWGKDMQLDFQAELSKAAKSGAEAIFVFYPGPAGPAFMKQYQQAGLQKKLALYSVFTVDSISLPRFQKAKMTGVLGSLNTQFWGPDLDNAANKRFVGDFKKKHGHYPSFYSAQAYDLIFYIKSAVEAAGGDVKNMDAIRKGLRAANYKSIRGPFKMGRNHFPVQNFYLRQVVADKDGNWTTKIVSTVLKNHADPYGKDCKM
jgi:branched-chain amino acid transport system substrate-binding protein